MPDHTRLSFFRGRSARRTSAMHRERRLLIEACEDRRLLAADLGGAAEGEAVELVIDNSDPAVMIDGVWTPSTSAPGFIDSDYLFARPESVFNPVSISREVTFTAPQMASGRYAIFARWTSHTNRATNVPITVNHRDGVDSLRVNQRMNGGTWFPLGEYNLVGGVGHSVTVGAEGVNGVVIADAVRLVRIGDLDPAPEPSDEIIVDNDDPSGVRRVGNWLPSTGVSGFFDSNYIFSRAVSPDSVTFTPDLGTSGEFEVFGRWTSHPNRASNATITVNHANGSSTSQVDQRQGGSQWVPLGQFELATGASNVVVSAAGANGIVIADAVRFVRVGDATPAPEISVLRDGLEVIDGGTVNFGTTTIGNPIDVSLSIRNNGTAQLNLTPPTSSSLPAGFTLVTAPASTLAPGAATTLAIRLPATALGTFSGPITLFNNDANENPYTLNLTGIVQTESFEEEVIVDNDDSTGVLITGNWLASAGVAGFFDADYLFNRDPGTDKVTFTPDLSSDGRYEVAARWTSHPNRASNTPITVSHLTGSTTTRVDQRTGGGEWVVLGEFDLQDGVSNVMVGTSGINGVAIADAVRFVRRGDLTPRPEISVAQDGSPVGDGGSVNFGTTTVGTPVDVVLTISNDGDAPLTVSIADGPPAGFALLSGPASTIQPGQTSDLQLRLLATSPAVFAGNLVLATNDADEATYELALQGRVDPVVSQAPEILILDSDGNEIVDGGTLDFEETLVGSSVEKQLTIRNTGSVNLSLTPINAGSLPNGFTGTIPATSTLAPGAAVVWTIRLTAANPGTFAGQISIANSDSNENPYDVTLQGTVGTIGTNAPEITILDSDGFVISDGGVLDFEETSLGSPVDKMITIRNDGDSNLAIATLNPANLPTGFTGISPPTNVISPGQSVVWTLRLTAATEGSFSGPLAIVNNDADENPYNITLQGQVGDATGPEIAVSANGVNVTDGGLIDFGTTTLGTEVNVSLEIRNGGNSNLSLVPLIPSSLPTGFTGAAPAITNLIPGQSTVWVLQLTATSLGEFGGSVAIVNGDADENPFDLNLQGTVVSVLPTAPEITVLLGGSELTDGGVLNFGSTPVGTPKDLTLQIRNDGDAALNLTSPSSSDVPNGFEVTVVPAATLAPGQSTSLGLRMTANEADSLLGSFRFANNDGDENPFDLTLQGVVTAPGPELTAFVDGSPLVDGGLVDFGQTAIGTPVTRVIILRNDGNANLTLTPLSTADLPSGYTVTSGPAQMVLPPGAATAISIRLTAATDGEFGGPITITNNDADENPFDLTLRGTVATPAAEIALAAGGSELVDGGVLDFGSTPLGVPVDVTVSVTNQGDGDLVLSAIDAASLPAGFALQSPLGSLTLTANTSTTFSLRLTAEAAGAIGGPLSLTNNDADENPFDLTLQGVVTAPELTLLVGGVEVATGGTVSFGDTPVGTPVDRVVEIRNDGNATLTLAEITAAAVPAGFELVGGPAILDVPVGQSVFVTLRMSADTLGAPSGVLSIGNNDSDENPYLVTLEGVVRLPLPEITVLNGSTILADGGTLDFGTALPGQPVNITLTIRNDGEDALSLPLINPNSAPAGFAYTLIPSATTLLPGQQVSLGLRMLASQPGQKTGVISLVNSDGDENPYDITLVGRVADARYVGTATGSGNSPGFGTFPVNRPVDFAIAGDQILVVLPNGGTGTVSGSDLTFSTSANGLGTCNFVGVVNAEQTMASGSWSCPALPIGGSASGTWQASRTGGEGEGAEGEETGWSEAVDAIFGQE